MSAASGIYKHTLEVFELSPDEKVTDSEKRFDVFVYTNQTIFDLKTNIGILLSTEGYRIDDEKHDIDIYIDDIRALESTLLSKTNIFQTKKVYFKKCEQKHKYINITIKDYSRPVVFKVHQDDLVQTLVDKIAKDLLIKSDKVKLIFVAKNIDNTLSVKESEIFDAGYAYADIQP
jgi:hypothetical protein